MTIHASIVRKVIDRHLSRELAKRLYEQMATEEHTRRIDIIKHQLEEEYREIAIRYHELHDTYRKVERKRLNDESVIVDSIKKELGI